MIREPLSTLHARFLPTAIMSRLSFFSCASDVPSADLPVSMSTAVVSGEALVHLSVPRIVANWRAERWYVRDESWTDTYLGTDAPFWVEAQRMHGLARMVRDGRELPPVFVSLSKGVEPTPCYPDGRHRIVLFNAMGITSIPAVVHEHEADSIVALLGADEVDPRLIFAPSRRAPRP